MKRLVAGILTILAFLSTAAIGVDAVVKAVPETAGPYEGAFRGVALGDQGSRASLNLDLVHRGTRVEGIVRLAEGLYVDGGWCGSVEVPAITQEVEGQTMRGSPRRLVVNPTLDVGGFELKVDFESSVSIDGDVISARATVDLPWFCGRDPVLSGVLHKEVASPAYQPQSE
jgi:hypothetical protein